MDIESSRLYVAAGQAGMYSCQLSSTGGGLPTCSADNGTAATGLLPVNSASGQDWSTVDAVPAAVGAGVEVYAGCGESCQVNGSVYKRDADGGWSPLVTATNVLTELLVADPTVHEQWWMADKAPGNMIGGTGYNTAQVLVTDGTGTRRVYSAGRSGVWRREGGNNWRPAVQGLSATVARYVAATPDGSNVGVADTDWAEQYSADRLQMVPQPTSAAQLPGGATGPGKSGYVTAFGNGRMYLALGDKTTAAAPGTPDAPGGVFSCSLTPTDADSCTTGPFLDEGLPNVINQDSTGNGNRVIGLAVGRPSTTAKWQLVAAVENVGIVRKVIGGGQGWDVVSASVAGGGRTPNNRVDIHWQNGSNRVYLYDPRKGLYRSDVVNDAVPRQWTIPATPVWTPDTFSPSIPDTNYMAGPRGRPDVLYVTTATAAYKISSLEATVAAGGRLPTATISATDGLLTAPGPVAVDDNNEVLIAQAVDQATPATAVPRLYAASVARGVALEQIGDAGYRGQALFPDAIAVSGGGAARTVWISDRGAGVTVIRP